MKRTLVLIAFLSLASLAAFAEKWTGTGYISDLQCATSAAKAKKATDWINPDKFEACAQKCAKGGSPVVFVTEDNQVLKFDADSAKKVLPHLGHRVSLTGKLEDGVLKVDTVATIKMDAKAKTGNDQEEKMHNK